MKRSASYPVGAILSCVLVVLLGLLASCSDDGPVGTDREPVDLSGQGEIDPRGDTDFLIGSTSIDGTMDGRIDVWAYDLTMESDSVVSFDAVLVNRSTRVIHPPVFFFITKLIPAEVRVLNPDIVGLEGPVGFDFSDDLGGDNKLEPGEHTEAVRMRFGLPGPVSFALGFRIEVGIPPTDHVISGVVFFDLNQNGERDSNLELGLPGVKVQLTSELYESTDVFEFLGVTWTDEQGRYGFPGPLRAGLYKVTAFAPPGWRSTSPNPLLVTLLEQPDGTVQPFTDADFGFFRSELPDSVLVFGPVDVGPGSHVGTHLDSVFVDHSPDSVHSDVLWIAPPPIAGPYPPPEIETASVWINRTVVYEFVCDKRTEDPCLPFERVVLPPGVIRDGENRIEITVEGEERAILIFSILRHVGFGVH